MPRTAKPVSAELLFRAFADRTRLRLLSLMRDRELCVCYFVGVLEINQPKISRHLAYLRRAGVVGARRMGKWIYYRIITPPDAFAARILHDTLAWLEHDPEAQHDRARLQKACCAPQRFIAVQTAPPPVVPSGIQTD